MGILSKLLPAAGAVVGNLIAPGIGGKVGAAIGGAAGSALSKSGGSKKATDAELKALAEARAIYGDAYRDAQGYQAPGYSLYGAGVNALNSRLGLGIPAGTPPFAPPNNNTSPNALNARGYDPTRLNGGYDDTGGTFDMTRQPDGSYAYAYAPTTSGGGMDWAKYGAENPDVLEGYQRYRSGAAPREGETWQDWGYGPNLSQDQFLQAHYNIAGQGEGRTASEVPLTVTPPASPGPGSYGDLSNPTMPAAYKPTNWVSPEAPPAFSYGLDDYKASPGYQYRQDQARKQVLASLSPAGARQSGAALKELYDRGDQIAYQDFGNERNFEYGLSRDARRDFETDRSFDRGVYEDTRNFDYGQSRDAVSDYRDQRNYLTTRFDRGTDDVFRATGIGQNAANALTGAAKAYGDQVAGVVTEGGRVNATNHLTQSGIDADFIQGLGGLLGSVFGGGSGTSRAATPDYVSDVGSRINYGNSLNLPRVY